MPIGIATRGADAWTWQDELADGVSVGAPPDLYNTQGQNWGIPPWAPRLLEQAKYEPFVQTIRALLRHAGGLRIDHVMGLFRLFWIPQGTSPIEGTYVEYPAEDLLNIVALESQRAGAFVVGEDLGTVGKNVRRMLADARILSNRLLWFESQRPANIPRLALAAVTTHDLPTVAGLWTGSDLAAQEALDLHPNAEATHGDPRPLARHDGPGGRCRCARGGSGHLSAIGRGRFGTGHGHARRCLSDRKRPNMPATVHQWPNWCIPLSEPLESLMASPLARGYRGCLVGPRQTRSSISRRCRHKRQVEVSAGEIERRCRG